MAYKRLHFPGGVDVEGTATSSSGSWNTSNLIRFRNSYAEKIGGWLKICNAPVTGVCRAINFWVDLSSLHWFGVGTNTNLFVESAGALSDISPAGFLGGPASSGAVPFSLLIWSVDNFGQVLIACPSGGAIYSWTPPNTAVLAAAVGGASPAVNQGLFVAGQQQIVIAYGCTPFGGGAADPLLIRWSDQGDYTDWTPLATNQAGSYRLSRGSHIISGISTPLANLIFTDIDVWSMQYIGAPLVFGFIPVGLNCGIIAQKAVGVLGSVVYWMSQHGFFRYAGGAVEQIPCSVWDAVFYNLDFQNQDKCCCLTNYDFNEVWFYYPAATGNPTGEIDSYVKFNALENLWDYGTLERTAGTDQNQPGGPIWVDGNGFLQQHENGLDADGVAMTGVSIASGFSDIADGQDFLFVDRILPDFLWTNSTSNPPTIQITMLFQDYPGSPVTTSGPYDVTSDTLYISCRIRGRQVGLQVSCDSLGTFFRLGTIRIRYAPSGRV